MVVRAMIDVHNPQRFAYFLITILWLSTTLLDKNNLRKTDDLCSCDEDTLYMPLSICSILTHLRKSSTELYCSYKVMSGQ